MYYTTATAFLVLLFLRDKPNRSESLQNVPVPLSLSLGVCYTEYAEGEADRQPAEEIKLRRLRVTKIASEQHGCNAAMNRSIEGRPTRAGGREAARGDGFHRFPRPCWFKKKRTSKYEISPAASCYHVL